MKTFFSTTRTAGLAWALLLLLSTVPILADVTPEGTFDLVSDTGDTVASITLESSNISGDDAVKKGEFTVTFQKTGGKKSVYNLTHQVTDGSGSHVDFVYAASKGDLPENPESYARGSGPAPQNAIFYILKDPELKGGSPIKRGEEAGTVTIYGKRYTLLQK